MKAAVIGAGIIGYHHVVGLQGAGVEVVAIADPVKESREKLAAEFGVKSCVDDYRKLLDTECDLITVCTPNDSHRDITVAFLNAGKHVICEKPIARTLSEADEMIAAAKRAGKMLFVALNQRFGTQNRLVKKSLDSAEGIGRPFMAVSTFIGNEFNRMNQPGSWKGSWEKSGGGVTIDNGFHMIDLLRWWFGEVKAVTASMGTLAIDAADKAEDSALINLEFESGMLASLTLTFGARYNAWPDRYVGAALRTEILGLEGAISAGNLDPAFSLVRKDREAVRIRSSELVSDFPVNEFVHFADCILGKAEPTVTAEDGRAALEIITAAYRSAREGRRVELRELRG